MSSPVRQTRQRVLDPLEYDVAPQLSPVTDLTLSDDSVRYADRAATAGADVRRDIWEAMRD